MAKPGPDLSLGPLCTPRPVQARSLLPLPHTPEQQASCRQLLPIPQPLAERAEKIGRTFLHGAWNHLAHHKHCVWDMVSPSRGERIYVCNCQKCDTTVKVREVCHVNCDSETYTVSGARGRGRLL